MSAKTIEGVVSSLKKLTETQKKKTASESQTP